MATRLQEMPSKRGRPARYPWDDWSDGSAWQITQGEDFSSGMESMRTLLYGKARDMGKDLEFTKVSDTVIAFQMIDKTASSE